MASLGVDTVYIDSLKDAFYKLTSDEGGQAVQQVFRETVSAGIEVVACHHQRKKTADNQKPQTLDDVYGSVFITAAAASVLLLWGEPSDPVIELSHLRAPAEPVTTARIRHDQLTGTVEILDQPDFRVLLRHKKEVTVREWAAQMFGKAQAEASLNEIEKARRYLDGRVAEGTAKVEKRPRAQGGKPEAFYSLENAPR